MCGPLLQAHVRFEEQWIEAAMSGAVDLNAYACAVTGKFGRPPGKAAECSARRSPQLRLQPGSQAGNRDTCHTVGADDETPFTVLHRDLRFHDLG
jgi:propanediol dehydratase large subunit